MEHKEEPEASSSTPMQQRIKQPEHSKPKPATMEEKGKEKVGSSTSGESDMEADTTSGMSLLTKALLGPTPGTRNEEPSDLMSQLQDKAQIEKNMKELEAMELKVQEMEEIKEKMREMEAIEERMKEMEKLEEQRFQQYDEETAAKRLRDKEIALSFLPGFTNEENKRLNEEVIDLEKQLQALQDAVESQDDRTAIMEEHMKRVKQEIYYTECRVDARRREIASEEHIKKISEMEAARIQRDVTKIEKTTEEMVDRLRALRTAVFRANEKMDQFRLLMHWNQEELEQWSEAAKQKNDDNEAVEAYTKMDDARLKELHMDEENIAMECTNVEKQLAEEVTATQAAQIQLNKTAHDFRELHLQRQKLVRLWEDSVEAIHKRDEVIHKIAEEYAENKIRLREKKNELDVLAKVLQNEIENDVDVKISISMAEEELGRKRELFRNEVSGTHVLEEELVLLKSNVTHATRDLSKQLSIKSHTDEELDTKKKKLETVTKQLARMRQKLEEEFALLDTLEKKMQALSRILAKEEQNLKTAKEEVHDLRAKQFQLTEKLHQLRTHEKNMLFEIEGAKSQSKTLNGQIQHLEMSMMKQEEVLYAAEFQIQCLERKVARAGGERTDIEKKETSAKIAELEKELNDKKTEETIILSQIKKSDEALRAAYRKKEELQKKLATSNDRNAELNLQSETGLHAVKKLIKEKEEKMLSSDLLQMEVNRLQAILDLKADEVTGMENTKKRLQMNFEEQKREIESRRDRHRNELKAVQDELHHLLIKRTKLAQYVQTLQSKYEVLIRRVQIEEGGERSANYYILKLAQERETIQREGKNLQAEIDKVQKDVDVLEEATQELREANNSLRTSHTTGKSLELLEEQSKLKQTSDRLQEQIRFKQTEEQSLLEEVKDAHTRFENLEKERVKVSESVTELRRRVEAAEKDSQDQAYKHKRAILQVEKLAKEVKEKFLDDFERIESEVHLVELKEAARDTLHRLKALANEGPAIAPLIHSRIFEAGLKMPSNTSSARSSRSGSSVGSLSGRSSLRGSVGSSAVGSPMFHSPPTSSPRVDSSPSPTGATSSAASPTSMTPPIGSPSMASPALSQRSSRSSSVVNLEFPT